MLKALVISPNERTGDFGCLLAIPRAEARRREQITENPSVKAIVYIPEIVAYVAVYQAPDKINADQSKRKVS